MPPPYDTVISIGGQSLIDGVWRLLGPALERLSNPLPISLPGFSNGVMRIKRIAPEFSTTPAMTGALVLKIAVQLNAEALLRVNVSAGDFNVALGQQNLNLTNLTGTIGLPARTGTLSNINLGLDVGGTGNFTLPAGTANITNGSLSGTLTLPNNLTLPGIPLPAVVPVPVNLTPSGPIEVDASFQLNVNSFGVGATSTINPASRFGLAISATNVSIDAITLDSALANNLTATLNSAVNRIKQQLGISIDTLPIAITDVSTMLGPVPGLIRLALADSLTALLGGTGRLVYPPAGTGASCDVKMLPNSCDARLAIAPNGSYLLHLGFGGRPTSSDIPAFPPFALGPGLADTTITIGNMFLLELLCCLVERLPAFTFPTAASTSTTDINGATHVMCCNFTGATVEFGMIALNGGLSVCLDGTTGSRKTITLVGSFRQGVSGASGLPTLTVADIVVSFTLPLAFDLNDVGSLANLRVLGLPRVSVRITPTAALVAAIVIGGILLIGPAVGTVALLLLYATCETLGFLLANAVNTVLRSASLVTSPVAIPSGVFEAFGKLVPVSMVVDDLTADSVLQTPTSPWTLLPPSGVTEVGNISTGSGGPEIFIRQPGAAALPEP